LDLRRTYTAPTWKFNQKILYEKVIESKYGTKQWIINQGTKIVISDKNGTGLIW
jgi:hypothetical protein